MAGQNCGVCERCRKIVPARHAVRDGRVYIVKDCPDCGLTEAIVSDDAGIWQRKRDLWKFDPDPAGCRLNCTACAVEHHPSTVFVDVTNRCNMNCPICIANIPAMGFEFNPPLSYFERVFDGLLRMKPKPAIKLFGGEPTVRPDLPEIIRMARDRGLRVGIVTNGLRLADEEYCRMICETRARILLAFDGHSPDIYSRLRKNPSVYEKKLRALENLKKYSTRRHTIMCCVARGVNDTYIRRLIDFCHENRDVISNLHFIPLTETWKEGEFETDVTTTIEDVERIVGEAFPGDPVEFLPAGLGYHFQRVLSFFGSKHAGLGGVHPNCESGTFFFSDGKRYQPVGRLVKRPLHEIAREAVRRAHEIEPKLSRLNPARPIQRLRGQWLIVRTFAGLVRRNVDLRQVFAGNPYLATARILGGLLVGKPLTQQLRKHTRVTKPLGMVVFPFEEQHSIEAERLRGCRSGFAFEDPDTGEIRTIPVCTWSLFQPQIERKITAKLGTARTAATAPSPAREQENSPSQ